MLRGEPEAVLATDRRTRATWTDLCVVVVALIALLVGYREVIEGTDWIVTTSLVMLIVGATAVVMHLIGLRALSAPIALLVELIVLGWVFAPSTLLVIVPTPATVDQLLSLAGSAGDVIVNEQAPVAAAQPIVLTIAASFGALVILSELLLRLSWPLVTVGGLLIAVFAMPSLITGSDASWWSFAVAAAAWLVLLRGRTAVDGPSRRARQVPAVLVGAGGLLAAGLFPVVTPDISGVAASWGRPPPQVFGRGINPMLELGSNLRRNNPVTVLRYSTELTDPPYLKVATLTNFDGETWRPARNLEGSRLEGRYRMDEDIPADPAQTTISIDQLRSELLPTPYPAINVTGLEGGFRWERTGQTIVSRDNDTRGQEYTVTSLDVQPSAEQLRATDPQIPFGVNRFTELVGSTPGETEAIEKISAVARDVAGGESTDYDRAKALQDWLRGTEFEYSEQAPVRDDYDGNGLEVLSEFLDVKAGYCVHFSSAMAVMARSLDIPSRIAVGYTSGTRGPTVDGEQQYEVQSDNLHAWTEVWFTGVGWVQFDPTPTIGEPTAFTEPVTPGGTNTDTDSSTATDEPSEETDTATETPAPTSTPDSDPTAGRSVVAVGGVLVLLLLAPTAVRRARRSWRLRPGRGADVVWREVGDTSTDLGLAPTRTETPRGFAQRLRARPGVDEAALDRLLDDVERTRFARESSTRDGTVADARTVVVSLIDSAATAERVRATVLPRSLAGRFSQASPEPVEQPAT